MSVTVSTRGGVGSFGTSVSISGDTAIVGAMHDRSSGSGSAYVFTLSGAGTWSEQAKLIPSGFAGFVDLFLDSGFVHKRGK